MVSYKGLVNQQILKEALGFEGKVNPVAYKMGHKEKFARVFEIRQEQQFVRRYEWHNLPKGLNATLMERILYYRGRLVVFKLDETFYSLPFALNGGIDLYGRYESVTPLTFNGSIQTDEKGEKHMGDGEFISGLQLNVLYDELDLLDETDDRIYDSVILNDYTQQISEFIIPRYQLNKCFIDELANIVVVIRHNIISSASVYTITVDNEGVAKSVYEEFGNMEEKILDNGQRIFVVTSHTKMNELLTDKRLQTQDTWQAFVSLDNLRENTIGIENNGIFKKKERQLKGEIELEASSADLVYEDGLVNRQEFANRINALFGLDVYVTESRFITGIDNQYVEEDDADEETDINMGD